MSLKRFSILITAFFMLMSGAAGAATITFQFSGVVTYGGPMAVPVGTPVVGTFSYDPSTAPDIVGRGYASYSIPTPNDMTLRVGSHTAIGSGMSIGVWNHYRGNVEDMVQIYSGPVVLDGTSFPNGTVGFMLGSAPRNNRPLNSTKLPSYYDLPLFNAISFNGGSLMTDGGPTGTLLSFTIDSIVVLQMTP